MRQRSSCDTGSNIPAGADFFTAVLLFAGAFLAEVLAVVLRVAMVFLPGIKVGRAGSASVQSTFFSSRYMTLWRVLDTHSSICASVM
jgi:hypothetical protein